MSTSDDEPTAAPPTPLVTGRGAAAWLVLTGALVALDGPVGGAVAVVVAAVLLARLSPRLLGAAGVAALAIAPLVVLLQGVPSGADVSPRFVLRSLLPHHLTFAGLVLVSVWVVLDVLPHVVASGVGPAPSNRGDEGDGSASVFSAPLALAVVLVVAVGAVVACLAVLQA